MVVTEQMRRIVIAIALAICCAISLPAHAATPSEPTGAPLPAELSYPVTQEFDLPLLTLRVKVQSLPSYDWPMSAPLVIVTVTNIGSNAINGWRVTTFASIDNRSLGQIAGQPPQLYLQPGESQRMLADLGQAQGLDTLTSASTVMLNWTVNGQPLCETPIKVTNWMSYFNQPNPSSLLADSKMTISGTVTDPAGTLVSAYVQVGIGASIRDRLPINSSDGTFQITVPRSTAWNVMASKAGYRTAFTFLDEARDFKNLRLVLYPYDGQLFTYASATTAESGNAFWQGTVSSDESSLFLSPGMESWPNGPGSPSQSDQRAMMYSNTGQKRWSVQTLSDAWGSDISSDGRWAAYAGLPGTTTNSQPLVGRVVLLQGDTGNVVWTRNLSEFATDAGIPDTIPESREVRFSLDGKYLAVGMSSGYLRLLESQNGTERWHRFLKGPIRSIQMSADGLSLYATSAARITARVQIDDGTIVWSKTTDSSWAHQTGLKESPDGNLLAVMSQEGITTVHDARSGNVLWSYNFQSKGHWAGFSADSKVLVVSTLSGTWGVVARTGARIFVLDGASGGGFAKGKNFFVLPSSKNSVGVYDYWGTRISNAIEGLDWSDPNYYFGWMSADGARLAFAKTYAATASTPVLFFVGREAVTAAAEAHRRASDCLFDWAQLNYQNLFAPTERSSEIFSPYYFRHFRQSAAYLATSIDDRHVYYLGPLSNSQILDVGPMDTWLATSSCTQ